MKKYQIALTGTFDVENFGDLMFPYVFEKAMRKKGLDFELTLFSPSDAEKMALDDSREVYSYKDFRRLNEELHFDALVVGGGALIHYKDFELKLPNSEEYSVYHNVNSWLTMIYLAAESNIKILLNVPQVPFEIPKGLQELTKTMLEQVDYIAVRDKISEKYLRDIYQEGERIPDIKVHPDTVLIVNELYDEKKLEERRRKLLPGVGKYMVLHFQSINGLDARSKAVYRAIANDAKKKGLEVVLLPIGYTFSDDIRMKEFNEENGGIGIEIEKKLDVIDIMSVLAGCEYYVGYSFHGAIVAMAFGGGAYSLNLSLKNQALFADCGVPERLNDNYKILLKAINNSVENGKKDYCEKLRKPVKEHFDNMYKIITGEKKVKKNSEELLEEIILMIPKYEVLLGQEIGLNEKLNRYLKEIEDKDKTVEEQAKLLERVNNDLELVKKSNAFKIGKKITRPLHYIKNLSDKKTVNEEED